ncbi:hypothetical protein [Acidihalobacter prosperus]|uniref:hypothetical protein n=1 Tax=Acidihalobacter prosperus TaxID=160660 RepID=UPI0011AB8B35|nr:hypothetical protein [Acidihalobacter prosperus]
MYNESLKDFKKFLENGSDEQLLKAIEASRKLAVLYPEEERRYKQMIEQIQEEIAARQEARK